MTVQTTDLGPNSAYVVYTSGETVNNAHAAIVNWVARHGWTLVDAAAAAQMQVFRAPNKNGTDYKYVGIGYDASGIYLRVFESWNATTHTGVNETYYTGQAAARSQVFDSFNGGYFYLFASSNYLVIYARTLGNVYGATGFSTWTGCLESTMDPRDTRGYPNFGFASGIGILGGAVGQNTGTHTGSNLATGNGGTIAGAQANWLAAFTGYNGLSLPRNSAGQTSLAAEKWTNVGCALGQTAIMHMSIAYYQNFSSSSANIGPSIATYGARMYNSAALPLPETGPNIVNGGRGGLQFCYTSNSATPLNTLIPNSNNGAINMPWAFTPWLYEMDSSSPTAACNPKLNRGKICGVKFLQSGLGNFMDTVAINCDSDGFMDSTGAPVTHHIIHGGPDGSNRFAIPV